MKRWCLWRFYVQEELLAILKFAVEYVIFLNVERHVYALISSENLIQEKLKKTKVTTLWAQHSNAVPYWLSPLFWGVMTTKRQWPNEGLLHACELPNYQEKFSSLLLKKLFSWLCEKWLLSDQTISQRKCQMKINQNKENINNICTITKINQREK